MFVEKSSKTLKGFSHVLYIMRLENVLRFDAMFGNDVFIWKFKIGLNLLFGKLKFSNLDLN